MTAASLRTPDLRLQRIGRAERGRFILVSKFLLGLFPEFVFLACGPAMALPDLVSALLDFFFRRLGHRVHLPPYCFTAWGSAAGQFRTGRPYWDGVGPSEGCDVSCPAKGSASLALRIKRSRSLLPSGSAAAFALISAILPAIRSAKEVVCFTRRRCMLSLPSCRNNP